jgi:hypothetical protein
VEDPVAELGLEGCRRNEVDAVANELTELPLKSHELEEANRAAEFDEQIDIAILSALVTRKRAEERHTTDAERVQQSTVLAQRFQDVVTAG